MGKMGLESAGITMKAGLCYETITSDQGSLNGPNLANRSDFYFLFWWTPLVIGTMAELCHHTYDRKYK
jgi:hypothetical protein